PFFLRSWWRPRSRRAVRSSFAQSVRNRGRRFLNRSMLAVFKATQSTRRKSIMLGDWQKNAKLTEHGVLRILLRLDSFLIPNADAAPDSNPASCSTHSSAAARQIGRAHV